MVQEQDDNRLLVLSEQPFDSHYMEHDQDVNIGIFLYFMLFSNSCIMIAFPLRINIFAHLILYVHACYIVCNSCVAFLFHVFSVLIIAVRVINLVFLLVSWF